MCYGAEKLIMIIHTFACESSCVKSIRSVIDGVHNSGRLPKRSLLIGSFSTVALSAGACVGPSFPPSKTWDDRLRLSGFTTVAA